MSSVPCVEYCSDEKSCQTSLLMELSPLSNNTQPSPKDSGVDVSSPSRRDEDTIFGSPQVPQIMSSSSNGTGSANSIKYSSCMLETSSNMLRTARNTNSLNITPNIGTPGKCSLETNSKKSDGKDSKTSKFYSRDRKKHFNIGELEAKEFRKIIMSDSKEKKKKCPLAKSSSTVAKYNGLPACLGTTLKKIPEDLNKNYAVTPIEEKKIGIVIRVTKPFSMYESKKRKLSADKLESPPKTSSVLNDIPSTPLEEDKVDVVDRSSNMSPTMPELYKETPFMEKETPFMGGKFLDESRRTTRSKINNLTPCGDSFLSERRSNLRSATKTTPQSKSQQEDSSCPLPPIITAIEPQQESPLNYLPKKITCKLADHVIVKTLTPDHQAKSCQRSKKSKANKSSSKEFGNYLQVKSISGLKIKLAKPRPSASETISVDQANVPNVSDCLSQSLDHLKWDTPVSENINSHLGMHNVCTILSVHTVSSPIMSSVQLCSTSGQNSVLTGSTCSITAVTGACNPTANHKLKGQINGSQTDDSLLDKDGKVKITQEKEVIMPGGKKLILKLKMLVPLPFNPPPPLCHEKVDPKEMEDFHPADVASTLCSEVSTMPQTSYHFSPPRRYYENDTCTYPSLVFNSLSMPGLSDKMNLASDPRLICPVSINNCQYQSASKNTVQFDDNFQSNEVFKDNCPTGVAKFWPCDLDGIQSNSLNQEHWSTRNRSNGSFKESLLNLSTVPEPALYQSSTFVSAPSDASKCNSNATFKSLSILNRSEEDVSSEGDVIHKENPNCAPSPSNLTKSVLCSQMDFNTVKAHSLESLSKGSMKMVRDELDEYGEMPTLEKNEISDQTYFFNQCNNIKLAKPVTPSSEIDDKKFLEDSKKQMLEKENLKERSVKKKFKFDGLELEYSVSGEDCATRCLRKRSKDEKDEPEKLERPEKPKRKRGISRSSMKKMKSSALGENSESLILQDVQIHPMSYAPTSIISPSPLFSNQDRRPESLTFSMPKLNQSFDFSTPPPSDASCPLGESALSLLDDSKSTPTVCSKPFYVNLSACSDSLTHSSLIASCSSHFVASSTTSSSSTFHISSGTPLPWSRALSTSPKSSVVSYENLNLSCFSPTRNLVLPVTSSHPSPLSSVFMTPLSAEIPPCPNSSVNHHASDSLTSITTSPPSPPPPPPKFVRSFKEVESVTDSLPSPSTLSMTSPIYPSNIQSTFTDAVVKESFMSSSFNPSDNQSGLSQSNGLFLASQDSSLLGCTETLKGSFPSVHPATARCNGRSKSALFEEKSLRLHRISQRLQANSAICLKSCVSNIETDLSDRDALEKSFVNCTIQPESEKKREACDKKIEDEKEEAQKKMLDDKLKLYYLNNEEEIAEYVADQVQLVKLRNKAYRLFCCLFPEVEMPLRLSPDSEAVDYLLESAVNMLEGKICEPKSTKNGETITPSEEKAQERSELILSRHQSKSKGQPHPCVTLCWQPHKCLLQLQGLVRRFLCLVLPHLDAYLSSHASLSVMDKIVDRIILANCAFIGFGSTNGSTHNGLASEECENSDETKNSTSSGELASL